MNKSKFLDVNIKMFLSLILVFFIQKELYLMSIITSKLLIIDFASYVGICAISYLALLVLEKCVLTILGKEKDIQSIHINMIIMVFAFSTATFIQKILYGYYGLSNSIFYLDLISLLIISIIIYVIVDLIYKGIKSSLKKNSIIREVLIAIIIVSIGSIALIKFYQIRPFIAYKDTVSLLNEKTYEQTINDIKGKKNFILVYGSKECEDCVSIIPNLRKNFLNSKETIYYVDANSKKGRKYFCKYIGTNEIPYIVKYKKGKVIQNYIKNPIKFFNKEN